MNLSKLLGAVWVILFILILTLGAATYYLYTEVQIVKDSSPTKEVEKVIIQGNDDGSKTITKIESVDTCGDKCKKEIDERIADAISELDLDTQKTTTNSNTTSTPAPTKNPQTTYISLSVTATSTSTDWVDVPGTQVYVDKYGDYGEDSVIIWEASLKVAHGNGTAYARLYDDTNKIAVNGSELITANNSEYEQKISGNLPLWNRNNLYKVQIKSLNGFEVTYSSGRIKISY